MNVEDAFRILGVTTNASLDEVKQAYRDLATVWHPDRHAHSPRLQSKAEEQLKQINLAYEAAFGFLKSRADKRQEEERLSRDVHRQESGRQRQSPGKEPINDRIRCPKCGYERHPMDDAIFSQFECPKCGIVYLKFIKMQKRANEHSNVIHMFGKGRTRNFKGSPDILNIKRHLSRNMLILGLVIASLLILWNLTSSNKTATSPHSHEHGIAQHSPSGSLANMMPHVQIHSYSPPSHHYQHIMRYANIPALNAGDREMSHKLAVISRTYDRPLDYSYVFHNSVDLYDWDTIKSIPQYAIITSIMHNFHSNHRYMGGDFYVCLDMAIDVWNLLESEGIPARIMVGNVQRDITSDGTVKTYLATMNHAWVLAEVSSLYWVPIETTGGYIVDPSKQNFRLYNIGTMFDNPRQCKTFNVSRRAMFNTCNATENMINTFNRLYAGKPITTESIEYTGRISQKLDDCGNLVRCVTAFLQQR